MKKGLYLIFNLKQTVLMFITLILFFSAIVFLNFTGLFTEAAVSQNSNPVIIIDAGHGGEDGGTQSENGTLEKDINLSISLKIDENLKAKGFETVLIRDGDYLIYGDECRTMREKKVSDIHKRMEIMNSYDNCIFLSIHQNYFTESKYSGAQVFFSKNNPESEKIALAVQQSIVEDVQPENKRQIKPSGTEIYLLYHAEAPAIMVECGFLSNEEEASKLIDEEYQKSISASIVDGLIDYLTNSKAETEGENKNGGKIKNDLRLQ